MVVKLTSLCDSAGIVAEVFTPPGPRRRARWLGYWGSTCLRLAAGRVYTSPEGDAVAAVETTWAGQVLVILAAATVVGVVSAGVAVVFWALLGVMAAIVAWAAAFMMVVAAIVVLAIWTYQRRTPGGRDRADATPKGAWLLHSLARKPGDRYKGKGRLVLDLIAARADDADASVYLDCEHLDLVSYYQKAGFALVWSSPSPDRLGHHHYRLVRPSLSTRRRYERGAAGDTQDAVCEEDRCRILNVRRLARRSEASEVRRGHSPWMVRRQRRLRNGRAGAF